MPHEGEILRFIDLENADYPIEQVGFIQEGEALVGAVWLGPPHPRSGALEDAAEIEDAATSEVRN